MPVTRSASLRVAHHKTCANATRTSVDSLAGCTCGRGWPAYYTFHRDPTGRPTKGERVRNRQLADRALAKLLYEIEEGKLGLAPRSKARKTFSVWADEYVNDVLAVRGRKGSTTRAYGPTVRYAAPLFGTFDLEQVGASELRSFVNAIRAKRGTDATVSKHLRHLGAIFEAACDEGLLESNPVPQFKKRLRLSIPSGDEAYTDIELAKLWAAMDALGYEAVYKVVAKASVVTGARLGELIGLSWDDLRLSTGTIEIRHTWDPIDGLQTPKDGEARTVHLLPSARALFEAWVTASGVQDGTRQVFPAPRSGERLNGQYVSRLVDKARVHAGLADVGEHGRKRKPFHAFRACYARLCREQGLDPQFVQAELGHSDPRLTLETYGKWSTAARLAEAAKAESFPV